MSIPFSKMIIYRQLFVTRTIQQCLYSHVFSISLITIKSSDLLVFFLILFYEYSRNISLNIGTKLKAGFTNECKETLQCNAEID